MENNETKNLMKKLSIIIVVTVVVLLLFKIAYDMYGFILNQITISEAESDRVFMHIYNSSLQINLYKAVSGMTCIILAVSIFILSLHFNKLNDQEKFKKVIYIFILLASMFVISNIYYISVSNLNSAVINDASKLGILNTLHTIKNIIVVIILTVSIHTLINNVNSYKKTGGWIYE